MRGAGHGDGALVGLGDVAGDGQAQPVAAGVGAGLATVVLGVGGVVGAGRIGAIEAVEQMR